MGFVPVYTNTFSGPDQNPVDPANLNTLAGFAALQVSGGHCIATTTANSCGSLFVGSSLSVNQAVECKVTQINDSGSSSFDLVLRANLSLSNQYNMLLIGNGTGLGYTLYIFTVVNGVVNTVFQNPSFTASSGDVFRFSVVGPIITVSQNGNPVAQAIDTQLSSGSAALTIDIATLPLNQIEINNFTVYSYVSDEVTGMGRFFGSSFSQAFSFPNQDVAQVVNEGGRVIWNLSSSGVTNFNPSSPTPNALFTYYGSSFSQAFTNPRSLDILQVVNEGGKVVFNVDYLGNAVTH